MVERVRTDMASLLWEVGTTRIRGFSATVAVYSPRAAESTHFYRLGGRQPRQGRMDSALAPHLPRVLLIHPMSVLLIFVDGLGIGTRGPHNPLHLLGDEAAPLAVFEGEEPVLPFGGALARTDATLGVEGRPQSASGQTTILTGVNAPAALGYHKQGFPNERMREIIREHSIFLRLARLGVGPNLFANAYASRFFAARPRWVSATTVAVEAAGIPFRTVEDLHAGRAVFHDFTNA